MNKKDKKLLLSILKGVKETKETKRLTKKIEKELKPISVRSRKAKGRDFQKYICERISCYLQVPWGYEDEKDIQPRVMGQSGVDIVLRGDARKLFPFAVEAKNQENLSLWSTVDQAAKNKGNFDYWVIMHKKNGKEPLAILNLEDFLKIYFKKDKKEKHD